MSTIIIITPPPTEPKANAKPSAVVRVIGDDDVNTINDAIAALADYASTRQPED